MNKDNCKKAVSYIHPSQGFQERTIAYLCQAQKSRVNKRTAYRFVYIGIAAVAIVLVAFIVLPRIIGSHHASLPAASGNQAAVQSSPDTKSVTASVNVPSPTLPNNAAIHNIDQSDKIKIYTNAVGLYGDAALVFTGECISVRPVFQNEMLYTLAQYRITGVFKGDLQAGSVLSVVEMGGKTTYGEYAKYCMSEKKPGDGDWKDYHSPDDPITIRGADGAYASVAGDKVLLFAGDASGFLKSVKTPLYSALGGIDGKFYYQSGTVYARALPASTDLPIFTGDKAVFFSAELRIDLDELRALQKE